MHDFLHLYNTFGRLQTLAMTNPALSLGTAVSEQECVEEVSNACQSHHLASNTDAQMALWLQSCMRP